MQGFNKYYPPDYEPSQGSLNKVHGKHALGDRARKLDQGILITRFELPFNIWCGTCNNHIGMGVRYNAEKKKIGAYYSTPIYSFRCKCHLCDGWFEIQTDPKHTRYVVTSGAKQKDEDWNPEENGGYAIHDTEQVSFVVDPLVTLEKATGAKHLLEAVQRPRIEALHDFSDHYNADPYGLSLKARKKFRHEKKIEEEKKRSDDGLKSRYGLPSTLKLVHEDTSSIQEAAREWEIAREGHRHEQLQEKRTRMSPAVKSIFSTSGITKRKSANSNTTSLETLRARILQNTAKRTSSHFP